MRSTLVPLVVLVLAAAACAGDDDAAPSSATQPPTSATPLTASPATSAPPSTARPSTVAPTTEAAVSTAPPSTAPPTTALVDPYDGHTSAVYDDPANWICRPDQPDDECRALDTTVLAADGTSSLDPNPPAVGPPVDCFYVYPTTSLDAGPVSDLVWGPDDNEPLTVRAQVAPYGATCRVFAPVYRQITLAGLGSATAEQREAAYADVLDAWQTYVSQWNDGRGVILIGHSQGTGHLVRLIGEEIDGVPELRDRLVAAHLFGGTISAPAGQVVGGTFQHVPACTSADETGCVVFWSSYPATSPVVPDAIFSRDGDDGPAICVDPSALLGRERATPIISTRSPNFMTASAELAATGTSFVSLPDALEVECRSEGGHTYLAVGQADAADQRDIAPLLVEVLGPTWGLHIVDMTVALGDLVDLAGRQGDAYVGSV